MTDDEFAGRLDKIAALAKSQREGRYSTEGDALHALILIETIALLLIEERRCGFVPPTPGYAPCTRSKGHEGPCAHPLDSAEERKP